MSWFLVHKHTCFPNAHAPIEYNTIASQIMGYKLCIVGQRWNYILLLIGFIHLHRVICLIHVYTYNTLNWGKRGCESIAVYVQYYSSVVVETTYIWVYIV